jgi:hypothetical protein
MLRNFSSSAGFEPANLGTRGQHANHQTTEAATEGIIRCALVTWGTSYLETRSVIHFLYTKYVSFIEIHCQFADDVMRLLQVTKWRTEL